MQIVSSLRQIVLDNARMVWLCCQFRIS